MLIKTLSYSILVLFFLALQEALILLSDCQASKQFFPLTVLRRVMKLYFHSQLQSIPLVGIHFSWVLLECPLGTLTAISCCCQSTGTLITDLWICCDLRVFLSPFSLIQSAKNEKNNSNSFAAFARRERGETWLTLWEMRPRQPTWSCSLKKSAEFSTGNV